MPDKDFNTAAARPAPEELVAAVNRHDVGTVQDLLRRGADIDGQDQGGYTPLMRAVVNYQPEMARLLISKGAAVDIKSHEGQTIWDLAGPFENMARILREAIADRQRAVKETAAAKTNALHATAADRQKDLIARARASRVAIKKVS